MTRFVRDGMVCQVLAPVTDDTCPDCLHSLRENHGTEYKDIKPFCLAVEDGHICLCRTNSISSAHKKASV